MVLTPLAIRMALKEALVGVANHHSIECTLRFSLRYKMLINWDRHLEDVPAC